MRSFLDSMPLHLRQQVEAEQARIAARKGVSRVTKLEEPAPRSSAAGGANEQQREQRGRGPRTAEHGSRAGAVTKHGAGGTNKSLTQADREKLARNEVDGRAAFSFFVQVRTANESNQRGHWIHEHRRNGPQHEAVTTEALRHRERGAVPLPCVIRLTRLSSKALDDLDGVASALKHVRDALSKWLSVDDGKTEAVRFVYGQRKCRPGFFGVLVEVIPDAHLMDSLALVSGKDVTTPWR